MWAVWGVCVEKGSGEGRVWGLVMVGWLGWQVCSESRMCFYFGAQGCRLRSGFLNPRLMLEF